MKTFILVIELTRNLEEKMIQVMSRTFLFILLLVPSVVNASEIYTEKDGVSYILETLDNTARVIYGLSGYSGDVVIPEMVQYNNETYQVTTIGVAAFAECKYLTSVKLPNSLTTIGGGAFRGCKSLSSIDIPSSVNKIGVAAFMYCGLTSISVPDGVDSLQNNVFDSCYSLESITIPSSIVFIGPSAFYDCRKLESVYISDLSAWCKINFSGRESNPLNNYQKLYINGNEVKDLVIPEDVERISSWAFTGCQSINSVTVSSGVKEIGNNAFYGCYSLESISLPNTLKAIENYAFYGCHITSLIIPSSVDTIGYSIIGGCFNFEILKVDVGNKSYDSRNNCNAIIETLTNKIVQGCDKTKIPQSVTGIGDYAFDGCNIYNIEIPNNVTEIGEYAFRNSFINSIDIPNNLQYIGTGAFYNCQNLRSVYLPENIKKVCDNTFFGCKNLSTISLPAEITEIGDYAFMSCETLYYMILPNTITHIGKNAFDYTGWYNVQNDGVLCLNDWIVGIKNYYEEEESYLDGAKGIADGVFENLWWPYETKLIIPQSIRYLGKYSLGTFIYTMDVYCYADEIPITDGDPFYYYEDSNCTLHVPANSLELYKSTEPWSHFKNIVSLTDDDPKPTGIKGIKTFEASNNN